MQMLRYTSSQTIKYFRAARETPMYLPITMPVISFTYSFGMSSTFLTNKKFRWQGEARIDIK